MPFTISHAAVVLPFSRLLARWRVLSAAVIGAMVPDFRVFVPWRVGRLETHSAMALFTFCLPVGMITYWLFQRLIKTPVLEVLPEGPYARWRQFGSPADIRSVSQWLLATGGVLAGALTHLVWDAFTHPGGRGVRMFPLLDDPIEFVGTRHRDAYYVLQDLSSLIGLAVVLLLVAYGLRRGREEAVPDRLLSAGERRRWCLTYVTAALAISAAFYLLPRLGDFNSHTSIITRAYEIAVSALRGLAAALIGVSLALDLKLRSLR
jgi:hypothetical protein